MTDNRTRFFSRWQRDCKRREMLRRMKLWMKEMSKKNDADTVHKCQQARSDGYQSYPGASEG
jgi:hypothetical protein